jgi:hypothetical protein
MPGHLLGKFAISTRLARGGAVALGCAVLLTACAAGATDPGTSSKSTSSTKATTTTTIPTLPQPTAAKPLTILDVGDSLGEDLGLGLGYTLDSNPLVHVIQAARGDTGLARPDYYNWPAHLQALLNKYHPEVVMILVGGNDSQSFDYNNGVVDFGSPQWHTIYSTRVALLMSEVLKTKAKLLWVGLPIMQDPSFAANMQMLNAIYQAQTARHLGVHFFSTWALFSNAQGQYSTYLTNQSGQVVLARDGDGIHIAPPGGCDIVAIAATRQIEKIWHVHLKV